MSDVLEQLKKGDYLGLMRKKDKEQILYWLTGCEDLERPNNKKRKCDTCIRYENCTDLRKRIFGEKDPLKKKHYRTSI